MKQMYGVFSINGELVAVFNTQGLAEDYILRIGRPNFACYTEPVTVGYMSHVWNVEIK